MKKLLLVISLLIPLLSSQIKISNVSAEDGVENTECDSDLSIVRIVDNYNAYKGNGFVYKVDNNYSYIVTTSSIISDVNSYGIIYNNGSYKKAMLLGVDSYNEVAVFRTSKEKEVLGVCKYNSNYLYKGQLHYLKGYLDLETSFFRKVNLSQVGDLYYSKNHINVFKSALQDDGGIILNGTPVFDELNRLVGMVNGFDANMQGLVYMVDSNKIFKIADSIVKTGNYEINYIKYSLVDYGSLSSSLKDSYGVNSDVKSGVVVVTFKPLNYVFGGLNQGMVIVAVNGVEINSVYDFDRQLSRYEKGDSVCLKVIKTNGKVAFYYVEI